MNVICRYELLEDPENHDRYGVAVEMGEERTAVPHITGDRGRAEAFLAQLQRCQVTPVSLMDVVEDYLGKSE